MTNNLFEVNNVNDLKEIMSENMTVILGLTIKSTNNKKKIMIRKFLKEKSKSFPLLTFVYMVIPEEDRPSKDKKSISIFYGNDDKFPKIYHIRDGNQIIVEALNVDKEAVYESFSAAEPYYLKEMENNKKDKPKYTININNSESNENNEELDKDNNDNNENNNNSDNNDNNKEIEQIEQIEQDNENNEELEKEKNLEKLLFMNKHYDKVKLNLIKEVKRRKKLEKERLESE
jgi:hypothetical protein